MFIVLQFYPQQKMSVLHDYVVQNYYYLYLYVLVTENIFNQIISNFL